MFKKILKVAIIIILVLIIAFAGFVGLLFYNEDQNKKLAEECETTNYNIKNVQPNTEYTLKNDLYKDKLKIKTLDIKPVTKAKAEGYSVFFYSFNTCKIEQEITYEIWFDDKILGLGGDEGLEPLEARPNFYDRLVFSEYKRVLDPSKEYNMEELFLNSFKWQTKNDLTLYTKFIGDTFISSQPIDSGIVIIVDDTSANMVDIPTGLFPSNTGGYKQYTDFRKNGGNLEITFSLDSEMIQTLDDPTRGGFTGEEEYAKLWKGGSRTFCFQKKNLYSEKERIRLKSYKEENPNAYENSLRNVYGENVEEEWKNIYGEDFDEHKYFYYSLCDEDKKEFRNLLEF